MKTAFPVYLIPFPEGYQVHFPNVPECITWGADAADALNMAHEALSACLLSTEDHQQPLPQPGVPVPPEDHGHIMAMVPVDTEACRRQTDNPGRAQKRVPAWMADLADQRGVSYSKVLQEQPAQHLGYRLTIQTSTLKSKTDNVVGFGSKKGRAL